VKRIFCSLLTAMVVLGLIGCADHNDNTTSPPVLGGRLYVVQSNDESLGEINLESGHVNSHVLDLGLYGNDIVKHGTTLYVANSGNNEIQEIDAETNQTLRTIYVGDASSPWSVAILNEDTMAVSCLGGSKVAFFQLSNGAGIGQILLQTAPEGMVVHQGRLYVCETGVAYPAFSEGQVRVYDTVTWQLLDSVVVGVNAQFAALDSLQRLHVVCTGNYGTVAGTIYVINLATFTVVEILPMGGAPNTVSFGGGDAFVAAGGFGGPGNVFRYRLSDLSVLNDATHPLETGSGAVDVEAMADGSFFVSCFEVDEVRHHRADGVLLHTYLVSDGPVYMVTYP
jgi:YVTN family beta-propeller protein